MIRALLLLSLSGLLGACSVLPEPTPLTLYRLPPSGQVATEAGPRLTALRLARPAATDALGGNRLLVLAADHSYQAYPRARWAAPVPLLWRDWLLDAFWRDGRVSRLSSDGDGLQVGLELGGVLRALNVEMREGGPVAVIRYDARLVDTGSRQILASRRFEAEEPMAGPAEAEAVAALGRAANRLARALIDWSLAVAP
ncbi:ABC-type transport auxiliary lipoprotein family protein [Zobellella iuensis]|uniref:Membrane integrity-associated transporter subunit PqiC n=1 Tax=Zobellella iuensis TaxID=2803811 RepID=A0ABS1QPJ8_9GAMM|nr:ABC-type transport auxiliary lipoprotein family protein [Zobellella iuensis]MBL1376701.1 membrane integrity-associated transporter subunit PqiC [Zobellella iuensis]